MCTYMLHINSSTNDSSQDSKLNMIITKTNHQVFHYLGENMGKTELHCLIKYGNANLNLASLVDVVH